MVGEALLIVKLHCERVDYKRSIYFEGPEYFIEKLQGEEFLEQYYDISLGSLILFARKNFMVAKSQAGARAIAVHFSLIH